MIANNANQELCIDDRTNQPKPAQTELQLGKKELLIQVFIQKCISDNIRGKENILTFAKENNIALSYSSIQSKINSFKSTGAVSLARKSRPDKGELKSFSNEVLAKLQELYADRILGGCAIRSYEDTHKYFRNISAEFVIPDTGESFEIIGCRLCEVGNMHILSAYTTKYIAGIYITHSGEELSIGSYASAARFLKHLKTNNSDALFLARYGLPDFRNKRQHAIKIDYSNLKPCDLICGDGKKLDLLIISDDWRRVYRPWLMGWEDMATRRYCYAIADSETSEAIANSLTIAIDEWGLPKVCKHDNGKAYRSGRFQMMKDLLGIESTFKTVKLARANPLESFHNILDNLLKNNIGYTGNKYQDFPQDTRERLKLVAGKQKSVENLEKMFKKEEAWDSNYVNISDNPLAKLKSSKKRFMHITELIELLTSRLADYHERLHGGLKKDKLGKLVYNVNCKDEAVLTMGEKLNTPVGRIEYYHTAGFIPVKADPAVVSLFAMNAQFRTVQLRKGISLNNEEFYSPKLVSVAGKKVLIRFTNISTDIIYVFYSDELQKISEPKQLTPEISNNLKFICIAEKQKVFDYNDSAFKEELIAQRRQEKELKISYSGPAAAEAALAEIHTLTGMESAITDIRSAENEYIEKEQIKKSKNIKKFKTNYED